MNYQIDIGNFDPTTEFVDVIGTMNNWNPAYILFDPDSNGIYSTTIGNLYIDEPYLYKFRINGSWSKAELKGLPNRRYVIKDTTGGFQNILTHWFNDEVGTIAKEHSFPYAVQLFPNPAIDLIYLSNKTILDRIIIYDITGNVVFDLSSLKSNKYSITISDFVKGIYIVRCIDQKGSEVTKKFVKN